jgi:hypothetical protein
LEGLKETVLERPIKKTGRGLLFLGWERHERDANTPFLEGGSTMARSKTHPLGPRATEEKAQPPEDEEASSKRGSHAEPSGSRQSHQIQGTAEKPDARDEQKTGPVPPRVLQPESQQNHAV